MKKGRTRKSTCLKKGELRVIRINEEALFEILTEHFMEHVNCYFDTSPRYTPAIRAKWNHETNEFTVVAHMEGGNEFDIDEIEKMVDITVDSVFSPHRYKSVFLNEL